MPSISYIWKDGNAERTLAFVRVEGTAGQPYCFGEGSDLRQLEVRDFFMATTPVTQSFWAHVMGEADPCGRTGPCCRS
jgi:hypothetical protein